MIVALDASYSIDPYPSGIALYSRELIEGLANAYPQDRYLHLYRAKQFRQASKPAWANTANRLLLPPLLPWRNADVFHGLNQRVDRRAGRRVVCTFHDLFVMTGEYSTPEFRTRFTQQAREAARHSDLILAVSEFTRAQVVNLLKVNPALVRVVPHGIRPVALPPALAQRARIILSVGALQLRKNTTRLVEAFEQLPESCARGWKLVLAGSSNGFGGSKVLARIRQSSRLPQIELRGYVNAQELAELYSQAAIFAFPSLDEGFGIPVLEAMANGVPVLTSNRSALPEVAGGAALLADPYRSEEIAQVLQQLMESETLCEELRKRGLQRVQSYSWEESVRLTHAAYRQM